MAKKLSSNWAKAVFALVAAAITAAPEISSAQIANVYEQRCAACHGEKGKGDGPAGQVMQPPVAPFSTALKGKSDSWIETVISKGGPAVGLSPQMPAHPTLSDSQLKDLTQYIKGLSS